MVGNPVWRPSCGTAVWIVGVVSLVALGGFTPIQRAAAQRIATADAPRNAETRNAESQAVTLDVEQATLVSVIRAIAHKAGLVPVYDDAIIPAQVRITLHLKNVPASAAFQAALKGTGLVAQVQGVGSVAIVQEGSANVALGSIGGVVRDAATQRPLRGASVSLDDSTKKVARTDDDGRYRFLGIVAGPHRVTVRLVGFARQTKMVTVADDQVATADFALSSSVNTLDQVVVTATGAQRYRELGHVVAQIDADSLVKEAPITSLSELLTARVPGLAVYNNNGGVVGGDVALRLRGQTTAQLDPQPIVIVDGVRYRSTSRTIGDNTNNYGAARPFNAEPRSPLNDLNVNDIETVDVVKGPSASTLYGPDAANGVIVITTKRGKAGKAQWHVYAYPDLALQPKTDATQKAAYRAWGHNPRNGRTQTANCLLQQQVVHNQQCVLDSITVVSTIANDPRFTVLAKDRPQWHSGASVSGGTGATTYFVSGNYDSQTGSLQLSPLATQVLKGQLGMSELSESLKDPNTQQTVSLHTNVSSQVNSMTSVNLVANYTQVVQRAIGISYIYNNTYSRGAFPPTYDTTNITRLANDLPTNAFLRSTTLHLNRITATLGGALHPFAWLTATGDVGTDLSSSIDRGIVPAGYIPANPGGEGHEARQQNTGRSANFGLTATAHPGIVSFRTSLGAQYTYANLDGSFIDASGFAPGTHSFGTAANLGISPDWSETASLGTYGEEVVGFNDRLFLTGSLRLDGSTTFGDAYHPRPFPKIGASWILSDEPFVQRLHLPGMDEIRLRYSFGAASRYPTSAMKNGSLSPSYVTLDGQDVPTFDRSSLANPVIRPERTRETEYGTDFTIASKNHLGLTWYKRRTTDQINTLSVPDQFLTQWANVGNVEARGFEATFGTNLFQARMLSVDLNASYAHNTNTVLSLGSASGYEAYYGSLAVGYPLDASIGQTVASYADTAGGTHDGIIERSEITLTPNHYLGVFYAPNVYTLTPVVSLFGAHVRVSALFDRQTGGVQIDRNLGTCGIRGFCLGAYLPGTPIEQQLRYMNLSGGMYVVSSDFTRWRELSVTTDLPQHVRDRLWLSRASMSLQVRNLWLWTKYSGTDPESAQGLGLRGIGSAANGAVGIPQARAWTLRFDVSP